ncbi:hypothetical protein D3C76_513930 [compost metagenome]
MTWLARLLPAAGALLVVGVVLGGLYAMQEHAYDEGYAHAQAEGQVALEQLRREHAEQAEASAKQAAKRLAEQQTRANDLAGQLAEQQRQNRETTDRLKGEITRVTTLYRKALDAPPEPLPTCVFTRGFVRVYDAANGLDLPTASHTGGAATQAESAAAAEQLDSGIDQQQLLDTHIRNAEQCRNTAAQLNRLIDLLEAP